VLEEELDGLIILRLDENQLPTATVKTLSMTDSEVFTQIEQVLQQTKLEFGREKLGLDSDELNQLFTPVELNKVALEDNAKTEEELNFIASESTALREKPRKSDFLFLRLVIADFSVDISRFS
jgi:ABC-2 type transport system permease protein